MEEYGRRQFLLRSPAGDAVASVLLERRAARCLIRISPFIPFPPECKAYLIDTDALFPLGNMAGEREFSCEFPAAGNQKNPRIGICLNEKLLYTQGAPEDFQELRLLFLRHRNPPVRPTPPKENPVLKEGAEVLKNTPPQKNKNTFSTAFPSNMHIETLDIFHGLLCVRESLSEPSLRLGVFSLFSPLPPPGLLHARWQSGVWWDDSDT